MQPEILVKTHLAIPYIKVVQLRQKTIQIAIMVPAVKNVVAEHNIETINLKIPT